MSLLLCTGLSGGPQSRPAIPKCRCAAFFFPYTKQGLARLHPSLPPARRHLLFRGQRHGASAHHWLPQVARNLGEDVGVLEVRGGLDDGFGALHWIARFEDAGADEDALG